MVAGLIEGGWPAPWASPAISLRSLASLIVVSWALRRGGPPLSFGHFPRERGKPDRTPAPGTLTLTLSRCCWVLGGEGIKRQGLFFSGFPRARE